MYPFWTKTKLFYLIWRIVFFFFLPWDGVWEEYPHNESEDNVGVGKDFTETDGSRDISSVMVVGHDQVPGLDICKPNPSSWLGWGWRIVFFFFFFLLFLPFLWDGVWEEYPLNESEDNVGVGKYFHQP